MIFPPPARSRPESAMHLRIPKTSLQVPSAAAVSGKAGIVRGTDDCGEKVISYIQPVPGSPWFLQSKIDEREDFALWRSQSRLLILAFSGIAALLLALGPGCRRLGWRRYLSIHHFSNESRASLAQLIKPISRISFTNRSFSMGFTIYEVAPPFE